MREHRNSITCAVATANGFAMPYRARAVQPLEKISAPKKAKKAPGRGQVRASTGEAAVRRRDSAPDSDTL